MCLLQGDWSLEKWMSPSQEDNIGA
jgi:hypothetical protein